MGLDGPGASSLGLALVAGVSGREARGWCGIVGLPDFGVVAAAGMGAAPERLLLVDEPGDRWPDVVAALVEAVDLVLIRTPEAPSATAVRRLSALARKHGCVLALTGAFARTWPGTRLRLRVDEATWEGLGDGHGVLTGRRAQITAEGRDAPGRGRQALVWLPGPSGEVLPAEPEPTRPSLEVVADQTLPEGSETPRAGLVAAFPRPEGGMRPSENADGARGVWGAEGMGAEAGLWRGPDGLLRPVAGKGRCGDGRDVTGLPCEMKDIRVSPGERSEARAGGDGEGRA
ncbi:hypothetical protein ACQP1W_38465 [Spirillospora sp. CA-255316]